MSSQNAFKTVLVTGASGQLGQELVSAFLDNETKVVGVDRNSMPIDEQHTVEAVFEKYLPDLVLNTAAFTAVDRAESEAGAADRTNRAGAGNLARACERSGTPLVHFSTDYVFDGLAGQPYREESPTNPLNVYGQSKLAGERVIQDGCEKHIILRVSWLFSPRGHNFVRTVCRLAQSRDSMQVVNDQVGCPTAITHLAAVAREISRHVLTKGDEHWGLYHYCDQPSATWFSFAEHIVDCGKQIGCIPASFDVQPISTEKFNAPANRPRSVVLDCRKIHKAFGVDSQDWRTSLASTVQSICQGEGY